MKLSFYVSCNFESFFCLLCFDLFFMDFVASYCCVKNQECSVVKLRIIQVRFTLIGVLTGFRSLIRL